MRDIDYYKKEVPTDTFHDSPGSEITRLKIAARFVTGNTILDAGCGNGHLLKLLSNNFQTENLKGFDLSPDKLNHARKLNPKVNIGSGDIYKINESASKFDTVFALEIIEHLNFPDKALRELVRVAKKRLVVTVPYNEVIKMEICIHCGKKTPRNRHLNSFTTSSFSKLVPKNTGLKVTYKKVANKFLIKFRLDKFLPSTLFYNCDRFISKFIGNKSSWLLVVIDKTS